MLLNQNANYYVEGWENGTERLKLHELVDTKLSDEYE